MYYGRSILTMNKTILATIITAPVFGFDSVGDIERIEANINISKPPESLKMKNNKSSGSSTNRMLIA